MIQQATRLPRFLRFLSRAYARVFGYFWLPCPACGEMFGGHQVGLCTRPEGVVCQWCSLAFRCCGGVRDGERLLHRLRADAFGAPGGTIIVDPELWADDPKVSE